MTPQLLVLGHITLDHIAGEQRLGGAAAYASRVAANLGIQTGLVTAAPQDFSLMAPLESLSELQIKVMGAEVPTTFELVYGPTGRTIKLLDRAPSLSTSDIPTDLRSAPAAYIAPVIGECPIELIEALDSPIKVAGLQGWLRHAGPDGTILPKQDFRAEDMPDGLTALVFSDEDHPDADALALELTKRVRYVVLTRGAHGLSLLSHGRRLDMPALDVPVVDPTGAGDTLGVVLTSSLLGGLEIEAALKRAIKAASLVIQGPELGRLDPKNLGPLNQAA